MPPTYQTEDIPAYASGWGTWDSMDATVTQCGGPTNEQVPGWVWIAGGALLGILLAQMGKK